VSETTVHLDDARVYRLVQGQLSGEDLSSVDEHLDSCPDCRAVVALAARAASGDTPPATPAPPPLVRGATLDRFVILEPIAAGAMGVVYAAYDPRLDRRVALKVLAPSAETPEAALVREAQAMARLQHPNVVAIHEVGRVGEGVYLAMELISGQTLRAWARTAPRSWREIRDAMVQVGRGLAAAHQAGLVHRDVKPDNAFLDEEGRARIGDFGLAHPGATSPLPPGVGGEGAVSSPLPPGRGVGGEGALSGSAPAAGATGMDAFTRTGALVGTPAYMAPEALRGERADARSDQFAFAVTFWELLHGKRPFTGGSLDELRAAIAAGPPAPTGEVPRWLDAALRRGLSARAADRFPALPALLDAVTVDQRRRGRGTLAAVAIAVVVGLVAGGAALLRPDAGPRCDGGAARIATVWSPAAKSRVRAAFAAAGTPYGAAAGAAVIAALDAWATRWAGAHDETCRATRVRGEQSERLLDLRMTCLERRRVELAALAESLAGADRDTTRLGTAALEALGPIEECADVEALSAVEPPPRGRDAARRHTALERGIAASRAALATGQPARAVALAAPLVEPARALGHRPTLAEARLAHAEALRAAGQGPRAEAEGLEALWAAEAGRDDGAAARAWITLLAIAGERGDLETAAQRGRHAAAAIARAGEPAALAAKLAQSLGLVELELGHLDAASRALERGLALRAAASDAAPADLARSHSALGNLARARGDLAAALDHHERARALDEEALGDAHPDVARDLHNVAGIHRLRGELDLAEQSYERSLAIKRAALGERHVDVGLTQNSLGLVALARGRLDDADARFGTALAIFEAARSGDRAIALENLGHVAAARGDARGAVARFTAALELTVAHFGEAHERVVRLLLARADAHESLRDLARARADSERAVTLARQVEGASSLVAEAEAALARRASSGAVAPAPPAAPRTPRTAGVEGAPLAIPSSSTPGPAPALARPRPTPPPPPSPRRNVGAYGAAEAWERN